MTIGKSLNIFRSAKILRSELKSIYSLEEAENISKIWVEYVSGKPWHYFLMHPDLDFTPEQAQLFRAGTEKLMLATPVQYLTGVAHFLDLEIGVGPGVLIPRPETEELVDWIHRSHLQAPPAFILDICSGSGCIGTGLGHLFREAYIYMCDKYTTPIEYSKSNLEKFQLTGEVFQCDILAYDIPPEITPDLIVSNPPYVLASEQGSMHKNVLDHEPGEALFVPDPTPLLFYKKIAHLAQKRLNTTGWIYFEIHESFGKEVANLLAETGFEKIMVKKDLSGKDRMVRGQKPA